jgi:tripartite-type tricarboxylate transporter receptor subunit TctC
VLRASLAKPDLQKRYAENAMEIFTGSPAELKAIIAADRKKWQEIIQSVGMKNE